MGATRGIVHLCCTNLTPLQAIREDLFTLGDTVDLNFCHTLHDSFTRLLLNLKLLHWLTGRQEQVTELR